jgi:hypothetical protein
MKHRPFTFKSVVRDVLDHHGYAGGAFLVALLFPFAVFVILTDAIFSPIGRVLEWWSHER